MASKDSNKFYPAASEEMAKLLGLNPEVKPEPTPVVDSGSSTAPVDIPVGPVEAEAAPAPTSETRVAPSIVVPTELAEGFGKKAGKVLLATIPYLLVFVVGVVIFYAFIADPASRPAFLQRSTKTEVVDQAKLKREALAAIKEQELSAYTSWITHFYFDVSDESIVAMDTVAVNKLTNFENYLIKLNPKMNDVRGTGVYDADWVLQGIDPISGNSLADWQRDAVAQYFDADAIRARTGITATPSTGINPRSSDGSLISTPLPGTSLGGCAENRLGINTSIPGRLEVPLINVNVPIIWTTDEKNFDEDLKIGVVHYPCTPLPGDIGTSYISGHSSNYAWIRADFNQVFARMNELPDGATFKVTVVGQDDKDIRLYYVVQRKQVYEVTDQTQFANGSDSVVALSTCWPINTNQKRMVAFGKLDRVER